ncbi:hypothetical protein GGI13_002697 [Coemansia sp. RSA 455]|nr:hypothetical protein LPJ71_000533 [Coemansia sp. S17]KAJ2253437.1 hypothetical protein GGI13_002697 [Coemansia sp. RSA 455]
MSVLGRGGRFRPCIANTGHTISNSSVRAENGGGGGGASYQFSQCLHPTASVRDKQTRSIVSYSREIRLKRVEGTDPRRSPPPGHSSLEWGRAIPYDVASRLVAELDMRNKPTGDEHQKLLGRGMPSSLMLKLNIKSQSDVRRRRQRHGLRAQVLAVLSELRLLIQACEVSGDRSGRVFHYLEELNRLYLDFLRVHALPLRLRSALSCTLDMRHIDTMARNPTVYIGTEDTSVSFVQSSLQGTQVKYNTDDITSPIFDQDLYPAHRRQRSRPEKHKISDHEELGRLDMIDPRRPSWIDYLIDDLTEAECHQLFVLVARSKVPPQTASKYRTAIEEALVFAFMRRGYALDPVESMRLCMYFIRKPQYGLAKIKQLRTLWKHAGAWCTSVLSKAARTYDGQHSSELSRAEDAVKELRFKRWNNVASEIIAASAVHDAWALVGEWHCTWTAVMTALCPDGRRGFVDGSDKHTFPYWRSKLPGRFRLHELTLSPKAINRLLTLLVKTGHSQSALELLGFATSEAGVPVDTSLFNIVLHGLVGATSTAMGVGDSGPCLRLPSLSDLPLVNSHAASLYRTREPDEMLGVVQALLRGMVRWRLTPDEVTLDALVLFCCHSQNQKLLDAVLRMFAAKWRIVPSESLRHRIFDHGLQEPEVD